MLAGQPRLVSHLSCTSYIRYLRVQAAHIRRPLEELEAGRAWIDEVMDSLPNSTMKVLTVSAARTPVSRYADKAVLHEVSLQWCREPGRS